MKLYKHYSDVDMRKWRWPNFSPAELASRREGELGIDEEALDTLQRMRDYMEAPLGITSAYRSKKHNRAVGGARHSQHLVAKAFDVQYNGHDPARLLAAGKKAGFTSFGFYQKSGFIHFDTRTRPASWGKRWFAEKEFDFSVRGASTRLRPARNSTVRVQSTPTAKSPSLWTRIKESFKKLFH